MSVLNTGDRCESRAKLSRTCRASLTALLVSAGLTFSFEANASNPKRLLIYYGWPSYINGSNGQPYVAANQFSPYDYVVLGKDLELGDHPDHFNTCLIVDALANLTDPPVLVFGYIHLGYTGPNGARLCMYNTSEPGTYGPCIADRIYAWWHDVGVQGVLLDEFGFDYGNDRTRQNQAIFETRDIGLKVIANAWRPEDVFEGNPPIDLAADDFYLFESHVIDTGQYQDMAAYSAKADKLDAYRSQRPFQIMSITTDSGASSYSDGRFRFAWMAAHIRDHVATGWGESNFSATTSQAPLRTPPVLDIPGDEWFGGSYWSGAVLYREGQACTYWSDFAFHSGGWSC
jgi:hypothetical protein